MYCLLSSVLFRSTLFVRFTYAIGVAIVHFHCLCHTILQIPRMYSSSQLLMDTWFINISTWKPLSIVCYEQSSVNIHMHITCRYTQGGIAGPALVDIAKWLSKPLILPPPITSKPHLSIQYRSLWS